MAKLLQLSILLLLLGFAPGAEAQNILGFNITLPNTLQDVLRALANALPPVVAMLTAFCYISGFWFIYRAVYKLRQYGELRTMMSTHTNLGGPVSLIAVGAILMFIPTSIGILENTFFGTYTATPLSYNIGQTATRWEALKAIVVIIIRVLGLIAMIRGFVMITSLSSHGQPHATWGRALSHVIGGALLININVTASVAASTVGIIAG